MISMFSLWMHYTLFTSIFRRHKILIVIVNWTFHVSNFLWLFMRSFKYGLFHQGIIWLIVSYFYDHYFHIQYNYCYEHFQPLLAFNNFLTLIWKWFCFTSFFSLKRFLTFLMICLQLFFHFFVYKDFFHL